MRISKGYLQRRIKSPENMFNVIMVYDIHCRFFPLRKLAKHVCATCYILVMQTIFPKKYLEVFFSHHSY